MTKQVALYVRVSTSQQTVQNQLDALREVASRSGYSIVEEFRDEGISGAKGRIDRPALDRMLKDCAKRRFDMVMVWDISRLGRSVQNLIETVETLNDLGITIVFQRENIDTKSAMGQFFLTVLGSLAQFEREIMRERINAGIARAKSQGKKMGRPSKLNDGLRNAVTMLYQKGVSIRDIAKTCTVGIGTVYKVVDKLKSEELQVAL